MRRRTRIAVIACAAGMESAIPRAVRWSGESPVRRNAWPAGLTTRSTALRKRASNK